MLETPTPSIRHINPPELDKPPGYSQVVEVQASRIIFIAGQTALEQDRNLVGRTISLHRQGRCSATLRRRSTPSAAPRETW